MTHCCNSASLTGTRSGCRHTRIQCTLHSTLESVMDSDDRSQNLLIHNVSEFIYTVLNLKCSDSLADVSQIKSFLDLVIVDGDATFSHVNGVGGGSSSILERRASDEKRKLLQSAIDGLCRFCERYRILLNELEICYCDGSFSSESIDLCPIVACDDFPSGGYFARTSLLNAFFGFTNGIHEIKRCMPSMDLPDDVEVGGFAFELARLIEDPIEKWIVLCEAQIDTMFPIRDDDFDVQSRNVFRRRTLRRRLVKLLSQHISMVNLFTPSTQGACIVLQRQPSMLTTNVMERLISDYADEETIEECEALRENSINRMELLKTLCTMSDSEELAMFVISKHSSLLETLRAPSPVLTRRPGYSSCDFRLHTLRSIVLSTTRLTQPLIACQLDEWKHSIGSTCLRQLGRFVDQAIAVLKNQKFPSKGFLATLRIVNPPAPTWVDGRGANDVYLYTRACIPISSKTDAAMQMPASTEQLLRLISLVWELLAYAPTRDFYFTPGRVSANFLREVVSLEKVSVAYAAMTLRSWKQKCDLGRNYRMASNAIVEFRGTDIENHLRESFARLSKWSLLELISVSSELFPSFHSTQWKLVDAVDATRRRNDPKCSSFSCCGVMGRILDVIEPLFVAMRSDVGVRAFARPHQFADVFRSIPSIRNWKGNSDELVLTTEDVKECTPDVKKLLHSLSDNNSIVRYSRAPKHLGIGSKRVFTFNGHDLKKILFEEV